MRSRAGKPDSLPDQPRAALEKPTTDALNVEKPKHENAGTVVTLLATPCFRPPTVEATWVPCPLHPVPSAGRMPLTAWHESHSVCSRTYEEGEG